MNQPAVVELLPVVHRTLVAATYLLYAQCTRTYVTMYTVSAYLHYLYGTLTCTGKSTVQRWPRAVWPVLNCVWRGKADKEEGQPSSSNRKTALLLSSTGT